jgi:uncharacterized protein
MIKKSNCQAVLIMAFVLSPSVYAATSPKTVMVPMRDGVKLATDVYRPEGNGPWPALLTRTPYNKDKKVIKIAVEATKRGYVSVVQNMRGRFTSEGDDYPVYWYDGWGKHKDGYDTVEWIAEQEWCNGKVGVFGTSAAGIAANLIAPSRPPHLICCYTKMAATNVYHQVVYQGGAFRKSLVEMWLNKQRYSPKNLEKFRKHPDYDDFWKQADVESVSDRVNVPCMFVGGWYDLYTSGPLNSFMKVNKNGGSGTRGKCRLVMEPYGHGHNDVLVFPNGYYLPKAANMFNWFDIWLKHSGKGLEKIPVVQYYTMGDPNDPNTPGNRWCTADNWPVQAEMKKVYLHPDKRLRLEPQKELSGSLSYKYDPKNPVPTIGGANLFIEKGPMDQRSVENRQDVLLFNSPTLNQYTEITGPIKVKLWISSTARDTDFTAKLCDVYPDGRSMIVLDGIIRARHRNSMEKSELLELGEIYELEIDLWATSLVFSPGHSIRIAISSSNAPRFEPNPNTGRPSGSDDETEVATNTVYVNAKHPSHVVFPAVER